MVTLIEGELTLTDAKFAVIVSRTNRIIIEGLLAEAINALRRCDINESDITIIHTPGVYEMPMVAEKLAMCSRYDAFIALGAVLRGTTPHSEYALSACSKGLAVVSQKHGVPISFGVLTADSAEQAIENAGKKAVSNGTEAVLTVIEMVSLLRKLQ